MQNEASVIWSIVIVVLKKNIYFYIVPQENPIILMLKKHVVFRQP